MNYFVEGLQGSGKSTLVQRLSEKNAGSTAIREGEYSPVELAWCAYVDKQIFGNILEKYSNLADEIISFYGFVREALIPKIDLLNKIRERFEATFTLEVVPNICCEHEKPCISPSMKVIDFCSKVRADLDIDWYIDNMCDRT